MELASCEATLCFAQLLSGLSYNPPHPAVCFQVSYYKAQGDYYRLPDVRCQMFVEPIVEIRYPVVFTSPWSNFVNVIVVFFTLFLPFFSFKVWSFLIVSHVLTV